MSEHTAIEWTDATWSPWEGCTKIGPGCDHCYAESMNNWLRKGANWGPGAPRRVYSSAHWEKPLRWNTNAAAAGKRMRVFPSVCDPFDNEVAPVIRAQFFRLIVDTPHLDWLLLTKRIGNAPRMLAEAHMAYARETGKHWPTLEQCWDTPPSNVWLGATVVNQEEAERDIPKLLALPATVRFLSIEPMLGPVDLRHGLGLMASPGDVDWVIAGGESGRGARPAHPDWFRSLRDQCTAAGVPFLFKQWGEWAPPAKLLEDLRFLGDMMRAGKAVHIYGNGREPDGHFRKGDDHLLRVGKRLAGRLLDGIEHNGFPA